MKTRTYIVNAKTPVSAKSLAVDKDRRSKYRGDYRGLKIKRLSRFKWEVKLT